MYTLYGIKNCDTVKKARNWLEQNGIEYRFHDFRGDGLSRETLQRFESRLGWETLLNRRSASWRQLTEIEKSDLNKEKAIRLMLEQPTLIKRPVFEAGDKILSGFTAKYYQEEL